MPVHELALLSSVVKAVENACSAAGSSEVKVVALRVGALSGAMPAALDWAWPLAVELAALLDEAHRAEIDLREVLPQAAALEHAAHWDRTVQFLAIVTEAWPAWLVDNGMMDGAARAVRLAQRVPPGD